MLMIEPDFFLDSPDEYALATVEIFNSIPLTSELNSKR